MNPDVLRAYAAAADRIAGAHERTGAYPEQEVTPPLLIEALDQCLEIAGEADGARALPPAELEDLGTHALNCVADLALWAGLLKLEKERAAVEDLAPEIGEWVARCGGKLAVLEPLVNALARRANAARDPERLASLAALARCLVAAAADAVRSGSDAWRTLNVNYAIIATRTQRSELMAQAYDTLEKNLPDQCLAFYEEGVRESRKAAYAAHVGEALRERLAKWTVRQ